MRNDHFDHIGNEVRERGLAFYRQGPADTRRPVFAALEYDNLRDAAYAGADGSNKLANRRTAAVRDAKANALVQARLSGRDLTAEELRSFDEEIAAAARTEAEVNAAATKSGAEKMDARTVANKLLAYGAFCSASGASLRRKVIRLGKGDPAKQLDANLALQKELRAEGERTRNAGTPINVMKEMLGAKLDRALAEKDPWRVGYEEGEPVWRHPVMSLPAVHAEPGRVVTANDLVPLLLSLAGDEIRERLMARIDEDHRGDTTYRITKEEKAERLAKIRADILEAQYEEGALRVLLAGDANAIAFRPQMDPRAILGVEGPPLPLR